MGFRQCRAARAGGRGEAGTPRATAACAATWPDRGSSVLLAAAEVKAEEQGGTKPLRAVHAKGHCECTAADQPVGRGVTLVVDRQCGDQAAERHQRRQQDGRPHPAHTQPASCHCARQAAAVAAQACIEPPPQGWHPDQTRTPLFIARLIRRRGARHRSIRGGFGCRESALPVSGLTPNHDLSE
jgi:hypothetical protein